MTCAYCGCPDSALCAGHLSTDIEWAASNRLMCDFLHRGRVPRRLVDGERHDDAGWDTISWHA